MTGGLESVKTTLEGGQIELGPLIVLLLGEDGSALTVVIGILALVTGFGEAQVAVDVILTEILTAEADELSV